MEFITDYAPLVVIVGQTASGKSALAIDLAQRFDGEIIAADSRTVYKGMDIGTAKPSQADQQLVQHHLIDIVSPDEPFTVADFQKMAYEAIEQIASRGHMPILVGGSGLYVDAVLYNFGFRRNADDAPQRRSLSGLSIEALQGLCRDRGISLPANEQNPRHLIRSLETNDATAKRAQLRPHTLVIGLQLEKELLKDRIVQRAEDILDAGLTQEASTLTDRYGWSTPALQIPAYRALQPYLAGLVSLEDARKLLVQKEMQYAKRQKTWFKRNESIHWISKPEQSVDLVTTFLNNTL